ncbi:MAG: hypothetical protein LBR17_03775 [Bacteroidales bacterium]|jgi:tetratricopeptide (TPR) repeat protein|nr:hypothetical protein [Bacteroidales bacterium]
MRYYLIIIFSIFISLCSKTVTAQESYAVAYEKQGDKAMKEQSYNEALHSYITARRFVKEYLDIDYKIGCCYTLLLNYSAAEAHFRKMILLNPDKKLNILYPKLYLQLAQMAKQNGKTQEALEYIEFSLRDNPDIAVRNDLKREQKAILWSMENANPEADTKIINLGPNINNAVSQSGGQLIDSLFLFTKVTGTQSDFTESLSFENMESFVDFAFADGDFHTPSQHLDWGKINNAEGGSANLFFDTTEDIAYFTQQVMVKGGNIATKIFFSKRDAANQWSKPKIMPFCSEDAANYTHPFVVMLAGQKILFFASDRPNGYGGYDLWQMNLFNTYSKPANLGNKINTPADEVTPFIASTLCKETLVCTYSLYFASNGHSGFGGFDIFKSKWENNMWEQPVNLLKPINSEANDLFPVVIEENVRGYLTSNRPDAANNSGQTCCNRIYLWKSKPKAPKEPPQTLVDYSKRLQDEFNPAFDLPLTLYFHNDEPKEADNAMKTNMDYNECYNRYNALKHTYAAFYRVNDDAEGEKQILDFFSQKIDYSMNKLNALMTYLLQRLEEGQSLEIQVRGFASALFTADYNFKLSERRINSLENYIRNWNGGKLAPYLDAAKTKGKIRLTIKHLAMGSSQSVSANPQNLNAKRNSVYTIEAMNERKIEIKIIQEL